MNCPYCGTEMVDGKLVGDHRTLKWIPRDRQTFMGLWAAGGVKVGSRTPGCRAEADTYYCYDCKKMVIDVANS